MNLKLAELHSSALAMAHVCTPLSQMAAAVGTSMASRMCTRGSNFVYQLASGSVQLIPKSAVEQLMPAAFLVESTTKKMTWRSGPSSMANVRAMAAPLIQQAATKHCAGLTKGLISASERVIRVVLTMMPEFEVKWMMFQGVEVVRYEFQYVLAGESGDLKPPKDGNKIEIALTQELEADLRTEILADLAALHDKGAPLAPGFLRQLGFDAEADLLEAKLMNQWAQEEEQPGEQAPALLEQETKKRKKRPTGDKWQIDCIVEEARGLRVRWVGYHPTWERFERAGGEPGTTPFETWEPLKFLQGTEALQQWRAA